jgi:hypothetical protein
MRPYLRERLGKPSSAHRYGDRARRRRPRAVAALLGCCPRPSCFTASASEADNLAVKGVALGRLGQVCAWDCLKRASRSAANDPNDDTDLHWSQCSFLCPRAWSTGLRARGHVAVDRKACRRPGCRAPQRGGRFLARQQLPVVPISTSFACASSAPAQPLGHRDLGRMRLRARPLIHALVRAVLHLSRMSGRRRRQRDRPNRPGACRPSRRARAFRTLAPRRGRRAPRPAPAPGWHRAGRLWP